MVKIYSVKRLQKLRFTTILIMALDLSLMVTGSGRITMLATGVHEAFYKAHEFCLQSDEAQARQYLASNEGLRYMPFLDDLGIASYARGSISNGTPVIASYLLDRYKVDPNLYHGKNVRDCPPCHLSIWEALVVENEQKLFDEINSRTPISPSQRDACLKIALQENNSTFVQKLISLDADPAHLDQR